jgi:hypothetical protein
MIQGIRVEDLDIVHVEDPHPGRAGISEQS